MPPISVLIKPSSGLCNMKCDYCFYCDETAQKRFMIVIDIPKMEHQHLTESDL